MEAVLDTPAPSKQRLWTGRVLCTLAVLMLVMDSVVKFIHPLPPQVTEAMSQLGFPAGLSFGMGILLLICTILYAVPATSVLGALLLTGYLGGAVALHVRVGNPLFSHVLFPVYFGIVVWAGLYLREPRLRALLPLRQ